MPDPSFFSTLIAIALIPVAILFTYTFLSGRKGWKHHWQTGLVAIIWDLTISIGYMVIRSVGGGVGDSSLELTGGVLAYFIIHGILASIVILLEFLTLFLGWSRWKGKEIGKWHGKVSNVLFILWWATFLSGEVFYVVHYLL
ncbi:MAG: hypothetical protein KAX80_02915 [Planctomycetes bacterium]|nr:hypothetical protein [Planctomycetota bacterium]